MSGVRFGRRIKTAWGVLCGAPTVTTKQEAEATLVAAKQAVEQIRSAIAAVRGLIGPLTEHESFIAINEEMMKLAVFLRENYGDEITRGEHGRFRTAVDAATFYMGQERIGRGKVVQ